MIFRNQFFFCAIIPLPRLINNNRETGFYIFIDGSRCGIRQIHAAVGAVASVDRTAEAVSPGGVVHALITVKWHPVSNI